MLSIITESDHIWSWYFILEQLLHFLTYIIDISTVKIAADTIKHILSHIEISDVIMNV